MKRALILLLTALSLNACKSGDEEQVVTVDNKYSVSLPSFLSKAKDLNDDASLQYQNLMKEFYIIVIDEARSEMTKALTENDLTETYSDDIDGYTELALAGMDESVSIQEKSDITDTVINKMPARLVTIKGKTDGLDVFYSFAFIQGKDNYYQLMTWTLAEKEAQHRDKMQKILYSFKEV